MFSKYILEVMSFMRLWENMVEPHRQQRTIWSMRITFWITKATNTGECVIFIAFLVQQWLRERTLVVRYVYTTWLGMYEMQFSNLGMLKYE